MISLGIETSCDETSASLVENGRVILSNVIASSLNLHRKHQGIIPEIASRAHIECISLVVEQALKEAGRKIIDIDLVCVTKGPGLIGSLLVGISFARGLSYALKKPLIGVDHLEAHLYASFLFTPSETAGQPKERKMFLMGSKRPAIPFMALAKRKAKPCLAGRQALPCRLIGLVVSGGHTSLFLVKKGFTFKTLGATVDDAAGEAFDKVAKLLGLGYPGGPEIERTAKGGNPKAVKLSCMGPGGLDFSFSGIKTAVLYKLQAAGRKPRVADMAASFQRAVVEALVEKSFLACQRNKIKTLVIGGGVAANNYLRNRFNQEADLRNIKVYFPAPALSLDNAAMIAGLGYQLYKHGKRSSYYLTPWTS
ncbi:MAG: tRNA (adenosine(37)-N6)-threonylcarbamoyltransferase complex transferase subunit TsaD [Omnitrophica WOR_2 bacterium RIFCSPLOWO2_02_FULL_45_28]|nr:MAG: tRNA (adenosine(37)-N6)-threonylcarbamoyltransferase complex transferase subunit TsaD [Omnitrophica WOR_2 bacterium RIFCSPLOWO2_02_FULL_45_28]